MFSSSAAADTQEISVLQISDIFADGIFKMSEWVGFNVPPDTV